MGVRGLMGFVENSVSTFYAREAIYNCDLIIDGFALIYELYFNGNVNDQFLTGEFDALQKTIDLFFSNLKLCGIIPIVIFDGPISEDKLPCVLNRLQDRVYDVKHYHDNLNKGARLLPLFAVEILQYYLETHGIRSAVTMGDADHEVVAVANELFCPVLSQDSDYYIYNIRNGYLPFTHFQWKQVRTEKDMRKRSIAARKYQISIMYNQYKVNIHLLPYLAVMLGNDWIDPALFTGLVNSISNAITSGKQKERKKKPADVRISSVLTWLAGKSSVEGDVLDILEGHLPKSERKEMMECVQSCVQTYRGVIDISETLDILKLYDRHLEQKPKTPEDNVTIRLRKGVLHPSVRSILDSKLTCLLVVNSNPKQPSPHCCTRDIRILAYRLLMRKHRLPFFGSEFLYIQEYDRVRDQYVKSNPISIFTSLCPMCEQHHTDEETCKILTPDGVLIESKETSSIKLLDKISGEFQPFLEFVRGYNSELLTNLTDEIATNLNLVMTSTIIWMLRTSPDDCTLYAVLLGFAWSCHHMFMESSQDEEYVALPQQFLSLINPRRPENVDRETPFELDVDFLHKSAQWLCVHHSVCFLHQIADSPCATFPLHQYLKSSRLLHKIHAIMQTLKVQECVCRGSVLHEVITRKLQPSPAIWGAFKYFSYYVLYAAHKIRSK